MFRCFCLDAFSAAGLLLKLLSCKPDYGWFKVIEKRKGKHNPEGASNPVTEYWCWQEAVCTQGQGIMAKDEASTDAEK